jgi:flagellar hook-associated protein 1 FlgK
VALTGIQQQIDQALESRLRSATSDAQAAQTSQQWLGQIETSLNALSGNDIGSQMTSFFNSWSTLANKPQDAGLRQTVLQSGDTLAKTIQNVRSQLTGLQTNAGDQAKALAAQADSLSRQIADFNSQIVVAEGGGTGPANGLRDQRGAALSQLSQLMNVTSVEQPNGTLNVYVGSEPLVLGTQSRGVAVQAQASNGGTTGGLPMFTTVFKSGGGTMNVTGGQLGALVGAQQQINGAIDKVDTLAKNLIFEVNRIHASGQGLQGISSVTASNTVTDSTVALTDPHSGLRFTPNNGSFVVHVKQKSTGLETSTLVQINLTGSPGDTTLDTLKASLAGINGVNASSTGGKLTLSAANPDTELSFSQDSSGVLAALGINNFLSGSNARDISVSKTLTDQPGLIAAAKNGAPADNQTALAIADLANRSLTSLKGVSLSDWYQSLVNGVASSTSAAKTNAEAAQGVSDTLKAQRDALSGVSIDEEAINLIKQQRAYQGAARLISTVDEMMKTLMAIT